MIKLKEKNRKQFKESKVIVTRADLGAGMIKQRSLFFVRNPSVLLNFITIYT